jgi:hypothetical protein
MVSFKAYIINRFYLYRFLPSGYQPIITTPEDAAIASDDLISITKDAFPDVEPKFDEFGWPLIDIESLGDTTCHEYHEELCVTVHSHFKWSLPEFYYEAQFGLRGDPTTQV